MNYIGSKYKLSDFIKTTIHSVAGSDLSRAVFCDIFAGTGIVGRSFKREVKKIISNDREYYSYVLNKHYIGNNTDMPQKDIFLDELNRAPLVDNGFMFTHYCAGGSGGRQYFSDTNGKKIDTMRQRIEAWKKSGAISSGLYYFLLASLLESADKVANTASVYGAYLKRLKKTAQKELALEGAPYETSENAHDVYHRDANELIKKIEGDILYMDPPYNERQYGANYHILNTIAEYAPFTPKGKTGLPNYEKSDWCNKRNVVSVFDSLLKAARFKYIFLSYNNEGLMPPGVVKSIMGKYGAYSAAEKTYRRFKADKDANRNHYANGTKEYLHVLVKNL